MESLIWPDSRTLDMSVASLHLACVVLKLSSSSSTLRSLITFLKHIRRHGKRCRKTGKYDEEELNKLGHRPT